MKIKTVVKMYQLKDLIQEKVSSAKQDDGKVDFSEFLEIMYVIVSKINEILEQESAR